MSVETGEQQAVRTRSTAEPSVELRGARLAYGSRVLWDGLTLTVGTGEFLAVLGPNGSGKTSLLRVLLGLHRLSAGTARVAGRPAGRGSARVGYVPQQKAMDPQLTLRGRDLVRAGLYGHRRGSGGPPRRRPDPERPVPDAPARGGLRGTGKPPPRCGMRRGERQLERQFSVRWRQRHQITSPRPPSAAP